jgi:hypothetical protein
VIIWNFNIILTNYHTLLPSSSNNPEAGSMSSYLDSSFFLRFLVIPSA